MLHYGSKRHTNHRLHPDVLLLLARSVCWLSSHPISIFHSLIRKLKLVADYDDEYHTSAQGNAAKHRKCLLVLRILFTAYQYWCKRCSHMT